MKKTASILFGLALLCAMAAAVTGCRTGGPTMSPSAINAALASTNHIGAAIQGGGQISAMMDKDAVLAVYKDVAMQAAKTGTEMSLTSIGHGASKQPNVQRESKATEKLTNSLASAIKAAKSGGSDPQALAKFGADLVGGLVELSEEASNPPAADDASLLGFDLKVGPGANLAGIAVAESLSRTRIESVKASRSTYSRVQTTGATESNTPAGINAITAAMVELQKLNSPAAVVGGSSQSGKPEGQTPAAVPPGESGTGEPSDSSPAARVAAMYPGMRLGGGNDGAASERSLWKPVSDSGGKLAVVLPHSAMGKIISMTVGGETVAPDSIGNGWRPHLRFSKPGAAYSGAFTIRTSEGDWTGTAPGGKRTDPIPMKKASGTLSVSDMIDNPPAEAPKGESATAPGES